MTTTRSASDDRADEDDQHWFDLLAGRSVTGASPTTQAEAASLRQALQQHRAQAPEGNPAAADARIARLLDRARADGVLPAARPPTAPVLPPDTATPRTGSHWHLPTRTWAGALAAGVASLAVVLWLAPGTGSNGDPAPESVQRGATLQQLSASDPAQQRQQLLQALRAAGFEVQPFDRLGRPGLDIALPVPLPAAQAQALADLGLAPAAGPSLVVELVPAAPAVPADTR